MSVEVRGIAKRFGRFAALDDVSLAVATGELVALLGPSGSGKTTLLRVIAGLETPDAGSVLFDGEDQAGRGVGDRGVGFVFQHYALFAHMSVFENVAFGLRVRRRGSRPDNGAIRDRVGRLLSLVHLDGLAGRRPAQLSGGQRQRVALARALAIEPRVLLLDEPFGSLDAQVRGELRRWLRRLHAEIRVTTLFVTHDQEEAFEVADRVAVMNAGRIEQVGAPQEVADHPATPFVMRFLGRVNVFASGGGRIAPGGDGERGYARPHEMEVSRHEDGDGLWAVLAHAHPAGAVVRLELDGGPAGTVHAEMARDSFVALRAAPGERLYLRPRRLRVFGAADTVAAV